MQDFFAAFALLLVLEGIIPFLSPQLMRTILMQILQMNDRELRTSALVSMVSGLLLIVWIR